MHVQICLIFDAIICSSAKLILCFLDRILYVLFFKCCRLNCAFTPQAARASKWPEVFHFQCERARFGRWERRGELKSGVRTSSHRCPTFCYGFQVEQYVSWKRCATGFEIRFLLFGGCVKNVSPINSKVYINHAVLKRSLHNGSKWSHLMCPLRLCIHNNWRY